MKLLSFLYFLLLRLRYKFNIIGFDEIDSNKKYIIFPNHQALVDPQIVVSLLGQKINISPVISETYYNLPVLKYFFKMMGAVSMGDIGRGTGSTDDIKNAFKNIEIGVHEGKNILLYPAGQLYSQGFEVIKGKKSAYNLVQILPDNVEILVIKTTGLWGSIWSKAWEGSTPNFFKTLFKAIFILIGNILLLVPKREVQVEIENYTKKLKNIKDINEFNKTLEDFYNKDGEEEIKYNKHFFYYDNIKSKKEPEIIVGSIKELSQTNEIDENIIPKEIIEKIIAKICEMKELNPPVINDIPLNEGGLNQVPLNKGIVDRPGDFINLKSNLINDLYFDSLDASEIKAYVQLNFSTSDNPPILDLKTVGDLCIMAVGKSKSSEKLKPCNWIIPNTPETTIYEILEKSKNKLAENTSILSLFKESFKNSKSDSFVYDNIFGVQSKKDFILKAYLIADYIKKIDGKYIGLMLPSVSSASLLIISTYLAGKIPVMLNWTIGETALLHCVKFAKIDNILTSKNFYDKVKNEGTEKLKNKYLFLEDLLKDIKLTTKLKALFNSFIFSIPKIKYEDEAVMLFTSGSESLPKAVSLTSKNIISDIIGALYHFPITNKDILIGFLPPFHSFGFSINTIMPLISGLKVAYTPDPNDSKTIGDLVEHCKITALTATPTFLNMVLNNSCKEKLKTLKYGVVGAEKCSDTVFELFAKLCMNGKILEGYGITECSPVISINPPSKPKKGSVGLPIKGSDVKIISLETQKEVGIGEQGMIYFSGDNMFSGYLDENLESPFEVLNPPALSGIPLDKGELKGDQKKYYKTGDLGYLDEEGYIYITGRLKRFIKIAGEMISLPFVEGVLNKKYGNNLAIEALEKDGSIKIILFSTEKLDLSEVQIYLRENGVSNLVKISEIKTLESLPILGTGKMDYKVLKGMISF